jgi:hypothetical protein
MPSVGVCAPRRRHTVSIRAGSGSHPIHARARRAAGRHFAFAARSAAFRAGGGYVAILKIATGRESLHLPWPERFSEPPLLGEPADQWNACGIGKDPCRARVVWEAQADRGAGLRHHQGRDAVPTICSTTMVALSTCAAAIPLNLSPTGCGAGFSRGLRRPTPPATDQLPPPVASCARRSPDDP